VQTHAYAGLCTQLEQVSEQVSVRS
jgi:hypothetical protein